MRISWYFAIIIALSSVLLSGCIKTVATTGYTFDEDTIVRVVPGKTKKSEVSAILGSPSSSSDYGQEEWYYISQTAHHIAFFTPKVIEQKILAVRFTKDGTVETVKYYSKDDMRKVRFASEETPTVGRDMGVLEQLLGNLGRFNPSKSVDPEL